MVKIIQNSDTLTCLKKQQLKTLNKQLSLLSAWKLTSEFTIQRSDSIIAEYKAKETAYKAIIINKDTEIYNLNETVDNQKMITKKVKKKWIKNCIFTGSGCLAAGLIVGIVIAK